MNHISKLTILFLVISCVIAINNINAQTSLAGTFINNEGLLITSGLKEGLTDDTSNIFLEGKFSYLGQIHPDNTPVVFAPGVVSQGDVNTCSFSPDGLEMVFTRWNGNYPSLFYSKYDSVQWTSPTVINFTGSYEMEAIFTPYGNQMFFASGDMANGKWAPDNIWSVSKENGEWKNPQVISAINTDDYEFYATLTLDTTMYFQRTDNGIYSSHFQKNTFLTPVKLGTSINSSTGVNRHPCISKTGTFLIFEKGNGQTNDDLYVSFIRADKSWSEPISLGNKINTTQYESQPTLSPDEKYLFFTRGNPGTIYWVKIDNVIDSLKKAVLTSVKTNDRKKATPINFNLYQNYPNPFNPSTTIMYSLIRSSQVTLAIYNLLGQKIKTLVDSFQSSGEHSLVWNAMDEKNNPVSSGIYFYRITTNDYTLQKKMILLE